jgi:leucyl-tRNA synthetase
MPERYEPAAFEAKWRTRWAEAELFKTREEAGRQKFYSLDFFPYPSGAGLSVGHCRNYVPGDVLARFKFMQGYNVLHPMGFDAFGLPAENAAIKERARPGEMIDRFAARYREQMDLVGISYDWSRSFKSSDPTYYKWTQWIFKKLYEKGLAYRAAAEVNWCPKDKTALANEEVVGGLCERCGTPVEKRAIPQWFFRITDYAQRLIDDLETIDWPEGVKALQRNWIGRSEGVEFEMKVSFASGSGTVEDELQALKEEVAGEAVAPSGFATQKIAEIEAKMFDHARHIDPSIMRENADLEIREKPLSFRVFTTRVDTIYGMTFCVLAPEHPLVDKIARQVPAERASEIRAYQDQAKRKSETERTADTKDKSGVFTGAYAINPVNGKRVPIWIADYVLATYGTGAIMAVPGHDERDFDFAVKYGLDVVPVIKPTAEYLGERTLEEYIANPKDFLPPFQSKDSVMMNSGSHDGLSYTEGTRQIGEWMEHEGIGERKVQYKLRDWLISRQRYWGCPIPIIHSKDGEMQLVPDDCLPVYLPDVESYEPSDDGTSPLARIDEFVNVTDLDGKLGRRETDTMGGFACSSWYFLRFCDPFNDEEPWNREKVDYWMPVDCYIGGVEHAVMHLLYARFWTKVFYDLGLVSFTEPFKRLKNQGQVLAMTPYRLPNEDETLQPGEDGILISFEEAKTLPEDQIFYRWARMSKSKGNVVTPEEAVEEYGADALRMFELFVAPFEADVNWSNEGMNGMVRFLSRVCRYIEDGKDRFDPDWLNKIGLVPADAASTAIRRATHKAIAKATEDIDRFAFNTYVSALMIYVNALYDHTKQENYTEAVQLAESEAMETLALLIAPGAPHTADELWETLGKSGFTYHADWPTFDPALTVEDTVTIAVQVNGKLRDTLEAPAAATKEELEALAQASEKVRTYTEGKRVVKIIVVPSKLVNIVVADA